MRALFKKTKHYQKSKDHNLIHPLSINRWKEAIDYYVKEDKEERINKICSQLANNNKNSLRTDLEYMLKALVFGVVGALTLDWNYANELTKKVQNKINNSNTREYLDLLTNQI